MATKRAPHAQGRPSAALPVASNKRKRVLSARRSALGARVHLPPGAGRWAPGFRRGARPHRRASPHEPQFLPSVPPRAPRPRGRAWRRRRRGRGAIRRRGRRRGSRCRTPGRAPRGGGTVDFTMTAGAKSVEDAEVLEQSAGGGRKRFTEARGVEAGRLDERDRERRRVSAQRERAGAAPLDPPRRSRRRTSVGPHGVPRRDDARGMHRTAIAGVRDRAHDRSRRSRRAGACHCCSATPAPASRCSRRSTPRRRPGPSPESGSASASRSRTSRAGSATSPSRRSFRRGWSANQR